jgi:hypothetical protein
MADQGLKLESFWTRNSGLLVAVIMIVVFTLGMLQDLFLVREGFSRWGLITLSNVVNGVIAAALFYQYVRNERMKRELIRERMHTIAELNHHIRNALQVIKFWGAQHQECKLDDLQLQLMRDSVDRIEWALRELLPSYPGAGDGGNVDAQVQPQPAVGPALPSARRLPQEQTKPH